MQKVLVVDDEPSITTLLKYNLEKDGYQVSIAYDGETALELAISEEYSFIILDLMLPKMDGLEVTRRLRAKQITTPILMLTAKDEVIDKIVGLEIGADDYLTKPFSPRELLARMKAVRRRNHLLAQDSAPPITKLSVGQLEVYPDDFQVLKNKQQITLTRKEFQLLVYFMERVDRVISRDTLLETLWQDELYDNSRTVDIHISHLREKIEDYPKKPVYLVTVRGFGYKFQEPK